MNRAWRGATLLLAVSVAACSSAPTASPAPSATPLVTPAVSPQSSLTPQPSGSLGPVTVDDFLVRTLKMPALEDGRWTAYFQVTNTSASLVLSAQVDVAFRAGSARLGEVTGALYDLSPGQPYVLRAVGDTGVAAGTDWTTVTATEVTVSQIVTAPPATPLLAATLAAPIGKDVAGNPVALVALTNAANTGYTNIRVGVALFAGDTLVAYAAGVVPQIYAGTGGNWFPGRVGFKHAVTFDRSLVQVEAATVSPLVLLPITPTLLHSQSGPTGTTAVVGLSVADVHMLAPLTVQVLYWKKDVPIGLASGVLPYPSATSIPFVVATSSDVTTGYDRTSLVLSPLPPPGGDLSGLTLDWAGGKKFVAGQAYVRIGRAPTATRDTVSGAVIFLAKGAPVGTGTFAAIPDPSTATLDWAPVQATGTVGAFDNVLLVPEALASTLAVPDPATISLLTVGTPSGTAVTLSVQNSGTIAYANVSIYVLNVSETGAVLSSGEAPLAHLGLVTPVTVSVTLAPAIKTLTHLVLLASVRTTTP